MKLPHERVDRALADVFEARDHHAEIRNASRKSLTSGQIGGRLAAVQPPV